MKKLILSLMVVSSILLVACSASFSARRAKEVLPQFLSSIYSITTVNHIAYFGSDSDFHYFFHSQLFGGGSYKIAKKKMSLQQEFPLSLGREPVLLIGRFDEATGTWISPSQAPQ